MVEKFLDDVGLDVDDTIESNKAVAEEEARQTEGSGMPVEPASVEGKLIRMAGPAIPVSADGKVLPPYDKDEDPCSNWKLNIEHIIAKDGFAVYRDQAGRLTANLHRLYINFAKFYEEGGTTGQAKPDLDSARKILEKGTKVNFKTVEDLAEIWYEWAELELRHDNYDKAIRVMQHATAIPKDTKINYHDHTLSAQTRLFKSLKLCSFYVNLEESIGTVEIETMTRYWSCG
ncbi:hypothetical protein D9758_017399 [Tetrapyrgos nigripes]|uniref:Pre-mRNA-splicing factor Syf1/CRNKL1-like C-terminal HAT-repeats domain-containing protein n=1 Tax=Tetrapyrgos nigripes TaxID=182062 RepID=A0A8H5C281_9AGAR|nr:hypothetical protein D9758_017399 [Tetrapyrgos nigripes]